MFASQQLNAKKRVVLQMVIAHQVLVSAVCSGNSLDYLYFIKLSIISVSKFVVTALDSNAIYSNLKETHDNCKQFLIPLQHKYVRYNRKSKYYLSSKPSLSFNLHFNFSMQIFRDANEFKYLSITSRFWRFWHYWSNHHWGLYGSIYNYGAYRTKPSSRLWYTYRIAQ